MAMPVNAGQGNNRCYRETNKRLIHRLCDEKKIFLIFNSAAYNYHFHLNAKLLCYYVNWYNNDAAK